MSTDTATPPPAAGEDSVSELEGIPVVLLDSCVRVEYGASRSKLISYDDFIESLSMAATKRKEGAVLEVFFPDNLFYFSHTASSIKVSCYYPEHIVSLTFSDDGGPVPRLLPNAIISFILERRPEKGPNAYFLSSDHIYFLATKKSKLELARKFYTAPIPGEISLLPVSNLYDNGRMCFGQNARIADFQLPDLRPLMSYYYTLVNSPFNRDLGVRAINGAFSTENWFRELARLAKAGLPFPYQTLGL